MARLLCVVLTALAANLVAGQTLASCGSSNYDPTQYTCYDGDFLCPIVDGDVYQKCGGDCYSTTEYSCFNGDFLCPFARKQCGETCYDPDKYDCFDDELSTCVGNFGESEAGPFAIQPDNVGRGTLISSAPSQEIKTLMIFTRRTTTALL
ncbi:carbohydrate binding-domain-containing protein [Mycena latifolia]|nr:carbohydrate binding-domain-containing protein [Mycena latifolia]